MVENISIDEKKVDQVLGLFYRYRNLLGVFNDALSAEDLSRLDAFINENQDIEPTAQDVSKELNLSIEKFLLVCEVIQREADKQFNLGYEAFYGHKNPSKALNYYRAAASLKHADALNQLGIWHRYGTGVEVDYEKSNACFRLAKNYGHSAASGNLVRAKKDAGISNVSKISMKTRNPAATIVQDPYYQRDRVGNTLAHQAAYRGNIAELARLLNARKSLLNSMNMDAQTPLIIAVLHAQVNVVNFLLFQEGVDLEAATIMKDFPNHPNNGKTALKHALSIAQNTKNQEVKLRMIDIIKKLVAKGAKFSPQEVQDVEEDIKSEILHSMSESGFMPKS